MIAAPLKPRSNAATRSPTSYFRDQMIAAPLKQFRAPAVGALAIISAISGPIEARLASMSLILAPEEEVRKGLGGLELAGICRNLARRSN